MELEHKNVSVAGLKDLKSEGEGIVEAIVSVTGLVDNVNDIIQPGAYEKTLSTRTPKGVWHHSWTEPVAKTLAIKELMPGDPNLPDTLPNGTPWPKEAGALSVKMQFNLDGARGKQAYSDVKFFGNEQEWSIGYNVPTGGAKVEQKSGQRHISTLDLYEFSPVLFGAMPNARTQGGVKDAQMAFKSLGDFQLDHKDAEVLEVETEIDEPDDDELIEDLENLLESIEPPDEKGMDLHLSENKGIDPNKIRNAIKALEDLIGDLEGVDDDYDGEDDQEEKAMPVAFLELKALEYDTLEKAVSDQNLTGESQLYSASKAFDNAVSTKDADAIEESASDVLDALETLSDEDEDGEKADQIAIVGSAIGAILTSYEQTKDLEGKSLEAATKTIRQRRREFLENISEDQFLELWGFVKDVRGNSNMKMAVEDERQARVILNGGRAGTKVAKKVKPKPKGRANVSDARREESTKKGNAMEDGSFPIDNKEDLKNAIQAHGRAKDPEAAKAHIKKRAKDMEAEDMLPDDWSEKALIPFSMFEEAGFDVKSLLGS